MPAANRRRRDPNVHGNAHSREHIWSDFGPATDGCLHSCRLAATACKLSRTPDKDRKMNSNGTPVVGWKSASESCGLSVASIRRMVAAGDLAAAKDEAGRYVFRTDDLDVIRQQSGPPKVDLVSSDNGTNHVAAKNAAAIARPTMRPVSRSPDLTDTEREIYELLSQGVDLGSIVLSLDIDPDWLRKRAAAWKRLHDQVDGSPIERIQDMATELQGLREHVDYLQRKYEELARDNQMAAIILGNLTRTLYE
jgi:hypothetical protein